MDACPVFLVTGSRTYPDLDRVRAWAGGLPWDAILVAGGARGVDTAAEEAFLMTHPAVQLVRMPAEWERYGRAAGPRRNQQMVERVLAFQSQGHPVQAFAFPIRQGSVGTADCMRRIEASRIPLTVSPA